MEEKIIGPRTSHKEFFLQHLKLELPEFAGIKEAAENDDIALADKLFADAMRKTHRHIPKLKAVWEAEVANMDEKAKAATTARAKDAIDYKVISCGIPWHFKDHKIDWEFNPTYNGYEEWPWQLNRHPEFQLLGSVYRKTGDEKYACAYATLLRSWIESAECPENISGYKTITWRTIEAGIRMAKNWHAAIHAFFHSSCSRYIFMHVNSLLPT